MQDIKIAIPQIDLIWEDKDANLDLFEERFREMNEVDFVLLPETFTTGFSMDTKRLAEPMNGRTLEWMRKWSKSLDAMICGSIIVEDNGYYNRLIAMQPNGDYQYYDKKHLFRMGGEQESYTAGENNITIEYKDWKINPFICYDLRFPVWCRNINQAEIMVFVSNWPEVRAEHWLSLLKARAIENQCFVLGSNRVGTDGNNVSHSGNSIVINPKGEVIQEMIKEEGVIEFTLSRNEVKAYRDMFPAHLDQDKFIITGT